MARRHHPVAGVGDDLDVGRVVVERVGALDRQQPGREPADRRAGPPRTPRGPPRDRMIVSAPVGACGERVGTGRQVERPRAAGCATSPAASRGRAPSRMMSSLRSSLRSMLRWRGDLVVAARTWSATLPSMQPRDVDVAPVAAHEQVAAPQQRIGVQVGDRQRLRGAPGRGRTRRTAAARTSRTACPRCARPSCARRLRAQASTRSPRLRQADSGRPARGTHDGTGLARRGPRTSSRNASERASRSSASRTNSRRAVSISRSMSGDRRRAAMASMSRRW